MIAAPADPHAFERMADAGVRRAVHWLPSGGRGYVERERERWQEAIARFNGE